jgi:hypothetical protein
VEPEPTEPGPAVAPTLPEWITPAKVETEPVATDDPVLVEAAASNEAATVEVVASKESATVDASAPTAVIAPPSRRPSPRSSGLFASAGSDPTALTASAKRFAQRARTLVRGVRINALVAAARALVARRVNVARIRTAAARMASNAGPLLVRARPWLGRARPLLVRARPLLVRARPLLVRARHNQIVMAVVAAALVLAVFIASPFKDAIVDAVRPTLAPAPTAAPTAPLARAQFVVPPLSAYGAAFESQAAYPTAKPNGTVEWVVALRNTGSAGWYRGIDGAQLALALRDGAGVAVQSTEYVAPGQVGWFVVHFRAREEPGTYSVPLAPRVDGRGPLADLGIHVVVTVTKNP